MANRKWTNPATGKSVDSVLNPPPPTPAPLQVGPDGLVVLPSGKRVKLRQPDTMSNDERAVLVSAFNRPGVDDAAVLSGLWRVAVAGSGVKPEGLSIADRRALIRTVTSPDYLESIPGAPKMAEADRLERVAASIDDRGVKEQYLTKVAGLREQVLKEDIEAEITAINKAASVRDRRVAQGVAAQRRSQRLEQALHYRAMERQIDDHRLSQEYAKKAAAIEAELLE